MARPVPLMAPLLQEPVPELAQELAELRAQVSGPQVAQQLALGLPRLMVLPASAASVPILRETLRVLAMPVLSRLVPPLHWLSLIRASETLAHPAMLRLMTAHRCADRPRDCASNRSRRPWPKSEPARSTVRGRCGPTGRGTG